MSAKTTNSTSNNVNLSNMVLYIDETKKPDCRDISGLLNALIFSELRMVPQYTPHVRTYIELRIH
jgi:hypothetical protein